MRESWPRWITGSVAKSMAAVAESLGLPVLVDGAGERTDAFMQAVRRVEIRITGPYVNRLSHEYWRADADVSVLITQRSGGNRSAYDIQTHAGAFQTAMSEPIAVYNYGSEVGDYVAGQPASLVHLGCLVPKREIAVRVVNQGQVHLIDRVEQVEINGKYRMEVEAS